MLLPLDMRCNNQLGTRYHVVAVGGVAGVLGVEPQGVGSVPDALQAFLLLQAY